jgi:hypothetical protein
MSGVCCDGLRTEDVRRQALGAGQELAAGPAALQGKPRVRQGSMKARHGPPYVGTMIWTSRAALGAGGRNGTDR